MLELDGGHDGGWNEEAATFGSVDRRVTSGRRGARRRLRLSCPSRSVKSGGPRIGGGHDDDDAVTLSSRREGQEDVVRTCGLQNPGDFAAAERKLRKRQRRELEKYNAKNGGEGRTVYRSSTPPRTRRSWPGSRGRRGRHGRTRVRGRGRKHAGEETR